MQPLWKHQQEAIDRARMKQNFALFFEAGAGKSRTLIEIVQDKWRQHKCPLKTIIVCPVVVLDNWKREWIKYSDIDPARVVVLKGTGKKKLDQFTRECSYPNDTWMRSCVVVTNYEAFQNQKLLDAFKHWRPDILVLDESHRCKNHKSKRAKNIMQVADQAMHRYLLTGTPVLKDAMDLFMQYRIMDQGETFGSNFWQFQARYFEDKNAAWSTRPGHFPSYELRPEMYQKFNQMIANDSMRVLKKDCLDLPPLLKHRLDVGMSPEQNRSYQEMKRDFLTWIKDKHDEPKAVIAQLAATKALRLAQIVTGFVKDAEGKTHRFKDIPRLNALEDILRDLTADHKVIVWAAFTENYSMIKHVCDKLRIDYAEVTGQIKDKDEQVRKFTLDKSTRVLIANQGAGGIGINLVEASYMVYYSKNFSLGDDIQSQARNYRGGSEQHEKITRIDLCTKGTIDELIMLSLENKQEISKLLIDRKDMI